MSLMLLTPFHLLRPTTPVNCWGVWQTNYTSPSPLLPFFLLALN
jgi:hypothetical protein